VRRPWRERRRMMYSVNRSPETRIASVESGCMFSGIGGRDGSFSSLAARVSGPTTTGSGCETVRSGRVRAGDSGASERHNACRGEWAKSLGVMRSVHQESRSCQILSLLPRRYMRFNPRSCTAGTSRGSATWSTLRELRGPFRPVWRSAFFELCDLVGLPAFQHPTSTTLPTLAQRPFFDA
jgi:hypothetical protein